MNTITNTQKLIIQPPGFPIDADNITEISSNGSFKFNNFFTQPLSPIVEAKFEAHKIKVNTLIFVNSNTPLESVKINQLFSISDYGKCKLQFFIYCSEEQMNALSLDPPVRPKLYKTYNIQFSTENTKDFPKNITLKDINIVQAFTWNIDPETSRGTETVVKGSNGG